MVPVPSYQLIPFLAWLYEHRIEDTPQKLDQNQLRIFAFDFLRSNRTLSDITPICQLDDIMWVFQTCSKVREQTLEKQMEHFAYCGQCLEVGDIPHHFLRHDSERRPSNLHFNLQKLHPLLQKFVSRNIEGELARLIHKCTRRFEDEFNRRPERRWFRILINEIGTQLQREFMAYLKLIRKQDPGLINDYTQWHQSKKNRSHLSERRQISSDEPDTYPICPNDSSEQVAERLAQSAYLAIKRGFYDEIAAQQPQFARLLSLISEIADTPENLGQVLEFLNWLRRNEPDLNLQGSIPGDALEKFALQFCEDLGYSNAPSFSNLARKYLSGQGSHSVLKRIAHFLGIDRQRPLQGHTGRNPLDRYGAVLYHGIFLFLSSGDFPTFIEEHWRDLHHLTGDDLDIYYSTQDLSERTSGYEVTEQLRSLQIRADGLPAFLLWQEKLEAAVALPLHELEHSEVMEVIKSLVQAIRDGNDLKKVVDIAQKKANEIRSKTSAMLVQSGATLVINNGGVMGDNYTNTGVAGAVGPNANVQGNTFVQEAKAVLSEIELKAHDADVFTNLSEVLAAQKHADLKLQERLAGAQHLASIAEAAKNGLPAEEPVAGWRQWLNSLGERAVPVLNTIASVTTIATPIAKLLGLPI